MTKRTKISKNEIKRNTFYQLPKFLFLDEFKELSCESKILYAMLKERHELSIINNWIDIDEFVYLIFSRENMGKMLNKSENTIKKVMQELKKYKLIEEKRQGQGKPNRIYLLTVEDVAEFQNLKYCGSETANIEVLNPQYLPPNNTKNSNTNQIDITSSSKKKNKEEKIDDDEIEKALKNLKDKKKGSLEIAPKGNKQENPNCEINTNKNIKEIQELLFDKLKTKISEKQAETLLIASNSDIERLKSRIDVAITQTINNVIGWLIDALKRPDEQYKVISTTAKKVSKKSKFANYTGRKWDYKEIEKLENEYIERKLKESDQEKNL